MPDKIQVQNEKQARQNMQNGKYPGQSTWRNKRQIV